MNIQKQARIVTALTCLMAVSPCLHAAESASWTDRVKSFAVENTAKVRSFTSKGAESIKSGAQNAWKGTKVGFENGYSFAKNNKGRTAAIVAGTVAVAGVCAFAVKYFFGGNSSASAPVNSK
jgi:hypothetical protein